MKNIWYNDSPIGKLGVIEYNGKISNIFLSGTRSVKEQGLIENQSPLIIYAFKQLEEYFNGKRKYFNLPLYFEGTDFKIKVWKALLTIPYGETRSYAEISEQIGKSKAYRAVGMANRLNNICIVIPCHRVIGKNGSMTGYFAGGIKIKQYLLELENSNKYYGV